MRGPEFHNASYEMQRRTRHAEHEAAKMRATISAQAARITALEAENAELKAQNAILQGRPLWGQQ